MIDFSCASCGKKFSVPDHLAGRKATCKGCGAPVTVPNPAPVVAGPVSSTPARLPMRTRRLIADAEQISRAFHDFPLIRIESATGDPPELYRIHYSINGLDQPNGSGEPKTRDSHVVEIQLTSEYPRSSPKCRMLSSIFHPNVDPATICVGDHWAAGERLVDLVIRIGEMIAYQAYNIKSPLDANAAMWADLNLAKLPIDSRSLRPPGLE